MSGKYYWIKLKSDFFHRKDIQVIESMPNGKDYVLFYLKLLVESLEFEGYLRLTDTIPYNADMLATITNTGVDTVRCAIDVFNKMSLIEIMDDETIYMRDVQRLTGSESKWAEYKRVERSKLDNVQTESKISPTEYRDRDKSIETEIECRKRTKKEEVTVSVTSSAASKKRFVKPSVEQVKEYCDAEGYTISPQQFVDFYESKGWMVGKNRMKDWKCAVRTWQMRSGKPKRVRRIIHEEDQETATIVPDIDWGD